MSASLSGTLSDFDSPTPPNRMRPPDRLQALLDQLFALLEEQGDRLFSEIDRHNPEAFESGSARYSDFLRHAEAVRRSSADLARFFGEANSPADLPTDQFPDTPQEEDGPPTPTDIRGGEREVRSLDASVPHSLGETFTHTRPVAFQLEGERYEPVGTWSRVYELTCKHLHARDPQRFARLPTDPHFISRRDRHDFATRSGDLRLPRLIAGGVYAEMNLSANDLRDRIGKLLGAFGLPPTAFAVYLRDDRPV